MEKDSQRDSSCLVCVSVCVLVGALTLFIRKGNFVCQNQNCKVKIEFYVGCRCRIQSAGQDGLSGGWTSGLHVSFCGCWIEVCNEQLKYFT